MKMENILKDKNENVSLGQLNFPSKSDAESLENMKENHNPKSLLEIASDSTSKFHLDASTPKNIRKSSSIRDSTFDMDLNISSTQQENITEPNTGLSFLLDGINNLKLKGTDASDDEDQFLSFNDNSNRNETLVIEKSNSELKNPQNIQNESNDIVTPTVQKQENEVKIAANNTDSPVKNDQTEINEVAINSLQNNEIAIDSAHKDEKEQEIIISPDKLVSFENCQNNDVNMDIEVSVHNNEKQENIAIIDKNTSIENTQNNNNSSSEEKRLMDTVIIYSDDSINHKNEDCITRAETNLSHNDAIENSPDNRSGNMTQILNDFNQNMNINATIDGSEIEAQWTEIVKENIIPESPKTVEEEINPESPKVIQEELNPENSNVQIDAESESPKVIQEELIPESPKAVEEEIKPDNRSIQDIIDVEMTDINDVPATADSDLNIEIQKSIKNQAQEVSNLNSTFDGPMNKTVPADPPTSSNDLNEQSANLSDNKFSCTFNHEEEIAPSNCRNPFDDKTEVNQNFSEVFQPNLEIEFKMPSAPLPSTMTMSQNKEEFKSGVSYNFGDSDFDYLQKLGSTQAVEDFRRDSILLGFDPLFEKQVPQIPKLENLAEEEECSSQNVSKDNFQDAEDTAIQSFDTCTQPIDEFPQLIPLDKEMSVEIMKDIVSENEKQINNLECEETKLSSIDHHENQNNNKLMELENKMRMEAEQREEVLLKRISEKDKQISKMNNVVKEYEKAIAELIAEKEQLVQSYEKKCAELKHDSEVNANHLGSLELTFSDLHAKYERTKQIAMDLKEREETILQERNGLLNSLKMQEVRYDKMKAHAISQLEIANNKLADNLRNHQAEVTKLKAQLKKEEISRASINEQLIQKSKENAELVKICDELIGNHGNSHAD